MKLKPCPFCKEGVGMVVEAMDHDTWEYSEWAVGCGMCVVILDEHFDTEEIAAAAWNQRADDKRYTTLLAITERMARVIEGAFTSDSIEKWPKVLDDFTAFMEQNDETHHPSNA